MKLLMSELNACAVCYANELLANALDGRQRSVSVRATGKRIESILFIEFKWNGKFALTQMQDKSLFAVNYMKPFALIFQPVTLIPLFPGVRSLNTDLNLDQWI